MPFCDFNLNKLGSYIRRYTYIGNMRSLLWNLRNKKQISRSIKDVLTFWIYYWRHVTTKATPSHDRRYKMKLIHSPLKVWFYNVFMQNSLSMPILIKHRPTSTVAKGKWDFVTSKIYIELSTILTQSYQLGSLRQTAEKGWILQNIAKVVRLNIDSKQLCLKIIILMTSLI